MLQNSARPNIYTIQDKADMSLGEKFQNDILRPIIKMKSDLLIDYLRDYLLTKKDPLSGLIKEKQIAYLESVFQRDQNLRSELRGVVIGQFTPSEYQNYTQIKSDVNKRIIGIIMKRIVDHLELLVK